MNPLVEPGEGASAEKLREVLARYDVWLAEISKFPGSAEKVAAGRRERDKISARLAALRLLKNEEPRQPVERSDRLKSFEAAKDTDAAPDGTGAPGDMAVGERSRAKDAADQESPLSRRKIEEGAAIIRMQVAYPAVLSAYAEFVFRVRRAEEIQEICRREAMSTRRAAEDHVLWDNFTSMMVAAKSSLAVLRALPQFSATQREGMLPETFATQVAMVEGENGSDRSGRNDRP